jgi:hypothetical protein
LQQLNQSNRLEREKKKVQFATLFQILKDGRPMWNTKVGKPCMNS